MSDRCLICRDTGVLLDAHSRTKPYLHLYHLDCIREWLTHSKKFTCVLCSGNFAPQFVRSLVTDQPTDFVKTCVAAICSTADIDLLKDFIINDKELQNHALVVACESGHLETTKFLLANGADVHNDALRSASSSGHLQTPHTPRQSRRPSRIKAIYSRNDSSLAAKIYLGCARFS
jgi:hypothetical protein